MVAKNEYKIGNHKIIPSLRLLWFFKVFKVERSLELILQRMKRIKMDEIPELGGKHFCEVILMNLLHVFGGANIPLLSAIVGLPRKMVAELLYGLEDRNHVRISINGQIWKINEEGRW